MNESDDDESPRSTATGPFSLPAETLDQAVAKAHAIIDHWKVSKPWMDDIDACYAVACHPGGASWGTGKN